MLTKPEFKRRKQTTKHNSKRTHGVLTASEYLASISAIFTALEIVTVASTASVRKRHAHAFMGVEIPSRKVSSTWTNVLLFHANSFKQQIGSS